MRLYVLGALVLFGSNGPLPAAHAGEPVMPRARPLTDRVFETSPARVERGRYLTEHLLQCFMCHSERDWDKPGAPIAAGRKGAGLVMSERADRRMVAPNLTPDPETGAGRWTDDMLARAIREGVGHDGRALSPAMWFGSFARLADEDLAAVVVYLRTLPPVRNALPPTQLPPDEQAQLARGPSPITEQVAGPPPGDTKALGRYLLGIADCAGCHTSWHSTRNPGLFAGGNKITRGAQRVFSANLTRHESGVSYSRNTFIAVMQTGKGGSMHPLMPWTAFQGLTAADLGAMYDALADAYPVAHYIGNVGEPRHCDVCGQEHPLGEHNKVVLPAGVEVPAAVLERMVGTYFAANLDWTIEIRREAGKLIARENEGGTDIELIPLSTTRYLGSGLVTPIEFTLPSTGAATGIDTLEPDRITLKRVR